MSALSRKAKQYLVLIAKILVVGAAFYFVYNRLINDDALKWAALYTAFSEGNAKLYIVLIMLFTFTNRFFEVLKWKALAGTLKPITLPKAAEQVFAAVTAAIFTPNGLGEYAAKALYYRKSEAKQVIFLNLICNGVQLIIALLAGVAGVVVFNAMHHVIPDILLYGSLTALILILLMIALTRGISIKGYSTGLLLTRINKIPKDVHQKSILLAVLRYLSIIHQHYIIFLLFGVSLPYVVLLPAIAAVYFLGSALPNFQIADFAVRGGVAILFFSLLGVEEWIIVFAATLQWLLNIVLPVAIGSYYVLRFKREPENTTLHQE